MIRHHLLFTGASTLFAGLALASCSDAPRTPPQDVVAEEVEPAHPSLILRASDLPGLRARAATSPWREFAANARDYARSEDFDPLLSNFDAKTRMTDLCGALALSYVLNPLPQYVDKLVTTLNFWPGFYIQNGEGTLVRWQQSAMTQSILALDVMHDALDPLQREALENMLDEMILGWWNSLSQDGTPSTPGVVALWSLYRGWRGLANEAIELYQERGHEGLAPSGVYDSGPGYAWVRQGSDRLSKYMLDDVLEFTGWDDGVYEDPRLATLHDWMYRGAFTPRRTNLTFGDSDPFRDIEGLRGYIQPYRVHRFSPRAARNAAWVVQEVRPRPLLSTFVLLDSTLLQPEPPTSTVWGDAASFWEANASEESLMGGLWSPRTSGSHSHNDVNSVHLYAYGENVLRNSGFCGTGVGVDATFDWDWIYATAASSNTVTVGETDHQAKFGGGIVAGFTAPGFDYATADAGPALEIATHQRSLLMVHGAPGLPGYFVLLDELTTDVPGTLVDVNLHPDSASVVTLAPATEYEWTVNQFGPDDVFVSLFLATPPVQASLLDGGLCAFDDREYVGKYLRARHLSNASGAANLLTLVVPHDATHAKPTLTRLPGGSLFSGASVAYPGGVQDFILAARQPAPIAAGQAFFLGGAMHLRLGPGGLQHYFARRASGFDDGAPQRTGFDSDADITLFVRDREVRVVSEGATVTFYEPSLTGTTWSNAAGSVTSAGLGFAQLTLNAGTFAFDLATGVALP